MAYNPINVGIVPDDNTGDSLRAAWVKVNEMTLELYTALAAKADDATVTGLIVALQEADALFATALAAKADATALATKAEIDSIIRRDLAAQPVSLEQRRNHARNSGQFVCVPFELLGSGVALDGAYFFQLPRFPRDFCLESLSLTVHTCTHALADVALTALLDHNDSPVIGQLNPADLPVNGVIDIPVVAPNRLIVAGTTVDLDVTITLAGGIYPGTANGLTLWCRGVWADGPTS